MDFLEMGIIRKRSETRKAKHNFRKAKQYQILQQNHNKNLDLRLDKTQNNPHFTLHDIIILNHEEIKHIILQSRVAPCPKILSNQGFYFNRYHFDAFFNNLNLPRTGCLDILYIYTDQYNRRLYTNQLLSMQTVVGGYLTNGSLNNSPESADDKNEGLVLKLSQLNQSLHNLMQKYIVDSTNSPVAATDESEKQICQYNRKMLPKIQKCFQVNSAQEFIRNKAVILNQKLSMIIMADTCCCGCISNCSIPICTRTQQNCYCCRYVVAPQLCINENKSSSCFAIFRIITCWIFCSTIWASYQAVDRCSQFCCCRSKEVKTIAGELLDIYNRYEPKKSKEI